MGFNFLNSRINLLIDFVEKVTDFLNKNEFHPIYKVSLAFIRSAWD